MSHVSTDQFLENLRSARVLDETKVATLRSRPEFVWGDIISLGRYAEQLGWLTAFQASQAAEGRPLLVGTYQLIDKVADGPSGPAYKVLHPALVQPARLRLISGNWLAPLDNLPDFIARTQNAALVQSPHFANLLDASTGEPDPFVVHEWIDGCDLFRLVNEMGAMPPGLATEYVRQAALAIAAAHEKGLPHGAVSPYTVHLTPVKRVNLPNGDVSIRPRPGATIKVLDFGLTPIRQPLGETTFGESDRLGPVAFQPPERFTESGPTLPGDVYSLGATLYYLLSARPPFLGNTPLESMLNLQNGHVPPIETLRSNLDAGLAPLIARTLDRSPSNRPSAAELAESLLQYSEPSARPGVVVPDWVADVPVASETFTQASVPTGMPVAMQLPEPAFADPIPDAVLESVPEAPSLDVPPPPQTDDHPAPEIQPLDDHGHDDFFGHSDPSGKPSEPKPKVKVPYTQKQKMMLVLGLCLHLTATCMCLGAMGIIPNPFKKEPEKEERREEQKKKEEPKKKKTRNNPAG